MELLSSDSNLVLRTSELNYPENPEVNSGWRIESHNDLETLNLHSDNGQFSLDFFSTNVSLLLCNPVSSDICEQGQAARYITRGP